MFISTHAPRTGSDPARRDWCSKWKSRFQPTLPARGATGCTAENPFVAVISTHAPRTGSDTLRCNKSAARRISTHAPRTGSDSTVQHVRKVLLRFQPTLPARGATRCRACAAEIMDDFNPRSPHGERLIRERKRVVPKEFQPTLPARGATCTRCEECQEAAFQPTLPARGATAMKR